MKEITSSLAIIKQKETNTLTRNDKKKIEEIKNEINLLSQKHLDNPFNTASIKLMKTSLQELEQEINNPASQNQSQSSNNQDSPLSNNNQEEINNNSNNNNRERERAKMRSRNHNYSLKSLT
ncbi:MAG: hypothetical protein mread185_000573 [Mycoplasmataceae bacterium]|nr:MAG: hypothetical protein mread185_000573 [Mycoplasmataceae bacterium]